MLLSIGASTGITTPGLAQLTHEDTQRIDSVFAQWSSPSTPGFAVGVFRNGRVLFEKGYGMADLEHDAPITPHTPFYVASMSKQFTAAALVILMRDGRLRLTDDVHKYLPELPSYGTTLTIEQLLHHTSGMRDYTSLLLMAGGDQKFEQHFDNRDVMELLVHQRALEFKPGIEYRYSNSDYVLIAKIVERVSGETLPVFAREHLFAKLGMAHSRFDDDYAALIPGRAESYAPVGHGRYERRLKHFDAYGDGGMWTTVDDLVHWDSLFRTDHDALEGLGRTLRVPGTLLSGDSIRYAAGLEHFRHRGHPTVEHNGGALAYTADMVWFPEDSLTVVVLGNTWEGYATSLCHAVANIVLAIPDTAAPPVTRSASDAGALSDADRLRASEVEGFYWNRTHNHYRRIVLLPTGVVMDWGEGSGAEPLTPAGSDPSGMPRYRRRTNPRMWHDVPPCYVSFRRLPDGSLRMTVDDIDFPGAETLQRFVPAKRDLLQSPAPFVGRFRSTELGVDYVFAQHGDSLTLKIGENRELQLFPGAPPNVRWNTRQRVWIGFEEISFVRDRSGRVMSVDVGDERVSAVRLERIP
jgi:CubicO group peptidase (beta-lactamase class C family)